MCLILFFSMNPILLWAGIRPNCCRSPCLLVWDNHPCLLIPDIFSSFTISVGNVNLHYRNDLPATWWLAASISKSICWAVFHFRMVLRPSLLHLAFFISRPQRSSLLALIKIHCTPFLISDHILPSELAFCFSSNRFFLERGSFHNTKYD